MLRRLIMVVPILLAWTVTASGTDRSFSDITVWSPSGEWKVTAASPDNRIRGRRPWQKNFVYSAFRHHGTELAWTRKQAEQQPHEDSPVHITVADNGWVAILTGRSQVVFVDSMGHKGGRVEDFKELIPRADREAREISYSGGLVWGPYSLWYFLPTESEQLFVVRLWWGRRIIIDPESGEAVRPTEEITKLADQMETERAVALLGKYEFDPLPEEDEEAILLGAYLAGKLHIEALIPWLQNLEKSEYTGITSFTGGDGPDHVDPFIFRCHTARQVARLSLRRLGANTTSLPIYEFSLPGPGDRYLHPSPPEQSVESQFPLVMQGMTAQEVLKTVGSPDFVVGDSWEYDVAGAAPATLVIEWKDGQVLRTRKTEAKWKEELSRDLHIVLF